MSKLINHIADKQVRSTTENGMRTRSSSMNECVNLFFMAGASRKRSDKDIIDMFMRAYNEDRQTALMLLAHIRDCRGGMGERRFFRVVMNYLANRGEQLNLEVVPEFGRWDDLFILLDTPLEKKVLSVVSNGMAYKNALLAKWLPRKGKWATKFAYSFGKSIRDYRKLIVRLTDVVETKMCNREWAAINYSHVPSIANVKYNSAFLRNDNDRRREFLSKAIKGEVKINSAVTFPHDIIKMMMNGSTGSVSDGTKIAKIIKDNKTAIAMWNNLPNYLKGKNIRMLPIGDTSGSMAGMPLLISLALSIYLSERNESIFKDAFITFSKTPELQYLKGNLYERLCNIRAFHPENTNLEATFKLVLNTAIKNRLTNDDMPTHLVIISDMEFDAATNTNQSALSMIKSKYKAANYDMPSIVFWNVNSRQDNIPVKFNKEGVALISGASPSAIKAVLEGNINPIDTMYRALNKDVYKQFAK